MRADALEAIHHELVGSQRLTALLLSLAQKLRMSLAQRCFHLGQRQAAGLLCSRGRDPLSGRRDLGDRHLGFQATNQGRDVLTGLFKDGVQAVRGPRFTGPGTEGPFDLAQRIHRGRTGVDHQTAGREHTAHHLGSQAGARSTRVVGLGNARPCARASSAQRFTGQEDLGIATSGLPDGRHEAGHAVGGHLWDAKRRRGEGNRVAKGLAALAVRQQVRTADFREQLLGLAASKESRDAACDHAADSAVGREERSTRLQPHERTSGHRASANHPLGSAQQGLLGSIAGGRLCDHAGVGAGKRSSGLCVRRTAGGDTRVELFQGFGLGCWLGGVCHHWPPFFCA